MFKQINIKRKISVIVEGLGLQIKLCCNQTGSFYISFFSCAKDHFAKFLSSLFHSESLQMLNKKSAIGEAKKFLANKTQNRGHF